MVLLPVIHSPFQAKFAGPYKVIRQEKNDNYVVATPDRKRRTQLCHANLLKPYFDRDGVEKVELPTVKTDSSSALRPVVAAPVEDSSECFRTCLATCVSSMPAVEALEEIDACEPDDAVLLGKLNNTESLANLPLLLSHLTPDQASELGALMFRVYSPIHPFRLT